MVGGVGQNDYFQKEFGSESVRKVGRVIFLKFTVTYFDKKEKKNEEESSSSLRGSKKKEMKQKYESDD